MVERKTSQDENAGLVHRRKDLVLASGISPSCVDVLKLRSQKDSSSFKLVTPFSNELIALKGGGGIHGSTLETLQVGNLSHNDFYET